MQRYRPTNDEHVTTMRGRDKNICSTLDHNNSFATTMLVPEPVYSSFNNSPMTTISHVAVNCGELR